MTPDDLRALFVRAATDALTNALTPEDRLALLNLAMTVVGEELFRIERAASGTVQPPVLFLLHTIALLTAPKPDPEALRGIISAHDGDAPQEA